MQLINLSNQLDSRADGTNIHLTDSKNISERQRSHECSCPFHFKSPTSPQNISEQRRHCHRTWDKILVLEVQR